MALVDVEGGFGFKPAGTSLASKLAGTLQTASQTIKQAAQTVQEPARQSTYEWYDDGNGGAYVDPATGNIWKNGLWYDPDNGQVWTEAGGWQTQEAYNAALAPAIEHDQAISNTFGALPPEGVTSDTTGAFRSPRQSFADVSLMLSSEAKSQPTLSEMIGGGLRGAATGIQEAGGYQLPTQGAAQIAEDQQRTARGDQIGAQLGGVHAIPQGSSKNLAGDILGNANRYFWDPFAETGAQLTPSFLKTGLNAVGMGPALDIASRLSPLAGGYDINKAERAGVGELGSALKKSGGNPAEFARVQQENLFERPMWQQLGASAIYDPTNVIGAGLATKALKGAQGTGKLSSILRGLGTANQYADVAQAKIGREAIGGIAGLIGNQAIGGEDVTGLNPVEAGLIGVAGGNLTRKTGSLPAQMADTLARVQGRTGLSPALGGQIDNVGPSLGRVPLPEGPDIMYYGTVQPWSGALRVDGFVTPSRADAELFARASSRLTGKTPEVIAFQAADGATIPSRTEGIAASRGARQVVDPSGLREVGRSGVEMPPSRRGISSESGAVSPKLATRAAGAALGGYVGGEMAPEDATPMERLAWIIGGAATGGVGLDAFRLTTKGAAKGYGKAISTVGDVTKLNKIGIGAERGIGHKTWLEDAPSLDLRVTANAQTPALSLDDIGRALRGEGVERSVEAPLLFKDLTNVPKELPLTARTANAVWDVLAKARVAKAAVRKNDPQVYHLAQMWDTNQKAISRIVPEWKHLAGSDVLDDLFPVNDLGQVLGRNGELLPVFDAKGKQVMTEFAGEKVPLLGAGVSDIADRARIYLDSGLITPEQHKALWGAYEQLSPILDLQTSLGIRPERVTPSTPDSFYFTRGNAEPIVRDATPTEDNFRVSKGKQAGSSKARKWKSIAQGVDEGRLRYQKPSDAIEHFLRTTLTETNAKVISDQLDKVVVDGAPLGATRNTKDLKTLLVEAKAEVKKTKTALRNEKVRGAKYSRDVRLSGRWIDRNEDRVQALMLAARDNSIAASDRALHAADAGDLSRVALDDTLSAAREYSKRTAKASITDADTRRLLDGLLAEGDRLRAELGTKMAQAENVDDVLEATAAAWTNARTVREALAADMAEVARRLDAMETPEFMSRASDALDAARDARVALKETGGLFADSITTARQLNRRAVAAAKREATAAANVRAKIATAKSDELTRIIKQREATLTTAFARDAESQAKITELSAKLQMSIDNRDAIKQSLASAMDLGRRRAEKYPKRLPLDKWDTVPVPSSFVNQFNKYALQGKGKFSPIGELFDLFNNALRFAGATADASRTATVGLLGGADNPSISAKGVRAAADAIKNPGSEWRRLREIEEVALRENLPSLRTLMGRGGLEIAPSEVLLRSLGDEASLSQRLSRLPVLKQAEALFSVPGNIERAVRAYDNLRALKAAGRNVFDDKVMAEAANAANLVSGRAKRGALAPILGDTLSSRIFFAGRFVESQFESVINGMLVGGIEGEVARRAFIRLIAGGAMVTYGLNQLQDQETEWNPIKDGRLNSNWMRVRVLGTDYSVFGPWDSFAKGMIAAYQGNPLSFIRGRLAPFMGAAIDAPFIAFKGEDASGFSADRSKALDYAPIPFAVRDLGERVADTDFSDPASVGDLALGGAAGFLGMKASPLSAREEYNATLEDAYQNMNFTPTGNDGQALNYPRPESPLDDPLFVANYAADHPDEVPSAASKLGKQIASIREEYDGKFAALNRDAMDDKMTIGDWKEGRKTLKTEQRKAMEPLVAQFRETDAKPGTPGAWVESYYATFDQATNPETGLLDMSKLDYYQGEWLKTNGPEALAYINALTRTNADEGIEREYLTAIQKLNEAGYFPGNPNSKPRFMGKVSDLTDEQIYDYAAATGRWSRAHPEQKDLPFGARVFLALKPKGLTYAQMEDVANSNKSSFEHYNFSLFKETHPELLAWLNPDNDYSTIRAIEAGR